MCERETHAAIVGVRRTEQRQQILSGPKFQWRRLLRWRLRLQLAGDGF